MNLRLKFTILLGFVIAITILLSASAVYWIAGEKLQPNVSSRPPGW